MGLWKEHFHWSVILRWEVLAWILAALPSVGAIMLVFDQYTGANVCFMMTAMFIFAKIAQLAVLSNTSTAERLIFTFILFGLVGIGITETMRGVNRSADSNRKIDVVIPKTAPPSAAKPVDQPPTDSHPPTNKIPSPPTSVVKTKPASEYRPNVTVDIGDSISHKWAFETRFIVHNPNPLPITNAGYFCMIPHAEAGGMLTLNQPANLTFATGSPIEDLSSGKSRSIYCDFSASEGLVSKMDPLGVNIWITYTYDGKEFKDGFRFFAKHKDDGTYAWFPGGDAEPLNPAPSSAQPTNPSVVAPLLADVRIASQRQVVSTRPDLPYGWEVVLQTNLRIEPVAFYVECDSEVGEGHAGFATGGAYSKVKSGSMAGGSKQWGFEWETPAFTPDKPIVITLYSKQPLKVTAFHQFPYSWP
jgi:hypothetical protein